MLGKHMIGAGLLATTLAISLAQAEDAKKYPDNWEGQWGRLSRVSIWDDSKPPGLGQQAPLTPEYQKVLEANLKMQAEGKDFDPKTNCAPPGMPRMMMIYQPMEIIFKPNVVYFLVESTSPIRRVFTDGRSWPQKFPPAFAGYSIGQWLDEDGDGRYDTLTVETRGISGKRLMDATIPLHEDDSTVVKERISLDKSNPDVMRNEITTIDNAFTRPWTVTRKYRRIKKPEYSEYNCEDKRNVVINGEIYWIGLDGFLMPIAKNQPPPDLRHFNQTQR
jgi:hypothetical protein